MNKHLELLACAAGLHKETFLDDSGRDVELFVTTMGTIPTIQTWERFAKLLLKDCATLVAEHEAYGQSYLGDISSQELLQYKAKRLVDHFTC